MIPPAETIEMAVERLKREDPKALADQTRELHEATGTQSTDFDNGYALGLATARVIIAGSAELALHGANPQEVL